MKYVTVLQEKAATRSLVKKSKFQHLKYLHLKLVKHLKTQLNNLSTRPNIETLGLFIYKVIFMKYSAPETYNDSTLQELIEKLDQNEITEFFQIIKI